jgi:hypothetical protein
MSELPARAFFQFEVDIAPRPSGLRIDGSLIDWGDTGVLPHLGQMEGREAFAQVRLAWDADGLYVGLNVEDKTSVVSHRQHPHNADALFLWVDTRDVRDAHRASRFCHHFIALPRGGGAQRKSATAWQQPIRRAREATPICAPEQLRVASRCRKDGYGLELVLPRQVLNGFDPEENSRLGFTYLVTDHEHGNQTWSVPGRFPFQVDPSTWAAVRLAVG